MERRRSEHVLGEDAFGEDIIMDSMAKDSFGDLDPDHKHLWGGYYYVLYG